MVTFPHLPRLRHRRGPLVPGADPAWPADPICAERGATHRCRHASGLPLRDGEVCWLRLSPTFDAIGTREWL